MREIELRVSQPVIEDYEKLHEELQGKVNNLAADLLEERSQRQHAQERANEAARLSAEARDRADDLNGAIAELREEISYLEECHGRVVDQRDEARAEVVRLGRELEQWKQAFGEDGLRVAKARLLDALGRSRRPWTDDERLVHEDGTKSTRVHVKRACNGCGDLLGDVTDEEMDRAIAGLPAEDARGECLTCTPLPSTAVSLDALSREVVRLRTIIGELGAAEAAEPQEEFEALRPEGDDAN